MCQSVYDFSVNVLLSLNQRGLYEVLHLDEVATRKTPLFSLGERMCANLCVSIQSIAVHTVFTQMGIREQKGAAKKGIG